jgi:hypothetical protein
VEPQTGNDEFDRTYFIAIKGEANLSLVKDSAFQKIITDLEPFASVRLFDKAVVWSRLINDESVLELDSVMEYTKRLVNMTEYVVDSDQSV